MTRVGGVLALAAIILVGCSVSPALRVTRSPGASGAALSGRTLYLRDCAWCHGTVGGGTVRAPDLVSGTNGAAFTDFMLSTGRMPLSSPEEPSRRGEPVYDAREIEAIVGYVTTLGGAGPPIPDADPELGHLSEGAELYQENCAACHSTTLIGGALNAEPGARVSSMVAPGLDDATPTEIAEAMLVGPGAMPVFGPETFASEEVNSLVRYVVHQQDPVDAGGAPLGHIGPVSEGAVGWIVGLGALLLVTRWIGTTVRRG
jgi:ubiquinol-cytochrome c reductase cytochrome c subunit